MVGQGKSAQQVAALPFVVIGDAIEVLLITSRRRGRWILPKGWPIKGLSLPQSAAREAGEEAGVAGIVQPEPAGVYTYSKRMAAGYRIACRVFVYPLLATQQFLDWPERNERTSRWVPLDQAADLVSEKELAKLLRRIAKDDSRALRNILDDGHRVAAETGVADWTRTEQRS